MALSKRSFISLAAASVNVTIKNSLTFSPANSLCITRSTKTRVFPEPAEADTNTLRPFVLMAAD